MKFKGLNVFRKYLKGRDNDYHCHNSTSCNGDCYNCLFGGDSVNKQVFKVWVATNEKAINWKPKEGDGAYYLSGGGCKLVAFRTKKLRDNALRAIRKLLKTLPKG